MNGLRNMPITANSAESVTRVMTDGQAFDFVNPPATSPAGRRHQRNSINQTGIDPYSLPQTGIRAGGFIPNLGLSPDLVRTIMGLGVDPKDVAASKRRKLSDFENLPDEIVMPFVERYRGDSKSLFAALSSLTFKGAHAIPYNDPKKMFSFLRGFMANEDARQKGNFNNISMDDIRMFAEQLTGAPVRSATEEAAIVQKSVHLRPEDVQKVFNLHGPSIPFIAAYEHPQSIKVASDRPNLVTPFDFESAGIKKTFQVPTPIYGHKSFVKEHFDAIKDYLKNRTKNTRPISMSGFGTMFGNFFDYAMKGEAESEGAGVDWDEDAPLDIYSPVKSILSQTNIKHQIAAMELKASAAGAMDSGKMAQKIFRTLAGEPGRGTTTSAQLKGPVGYVPKLVNIQKFQGHAGGIGIIDYDAFGQGQSAYDALIYAAVATGKPMRVHYGPMTMGKTTAAEKIVNMAGGLGSKGGDYVSGLQDIDSDKFKQFIINKTDRVEIDKGVFGLALSSASQVRSFYSPFEEYEARHSEMVRRLKERNRGQEGKNAEAIARSYSREEWDQYSKNIGHLGQKLGAERMQNYNPDNPMAAGGSIPTLNELKKKFDGWSIERILEHNVDIQGLYERGFQFLGKGAQSFTFATPSGKSALKYDYARRDDYDEKVKRTNSANKLWSLLGLPIQSPPARLVNSSASLEKLFGANDITKGPKFMMQKRVKGPTLGYFDKYRRADYAGVSPAFDLMHKLKEMTYTDEASEMRKKHNLHYPYVDTGSSSNFIVEGKYVQELRKIIKASANREELQQRWLESDVKISAIDLAQGFIPNLAWPKFPSFSVGRPGGSAINRASMGVSDNYFQPLIDAEISKISQITQHGQRHQMLQQLMSHYGPEYGKKINTIIEDGGTDDPRDSLWNNIKGFLGEKFAAQMLTQSGVQGLTKLPESAGFDFMGQIGGKNALIEVRNQLKIGNYKKFLSKLQSAQINYPEHDKWIIGNDQTTYSGKAAGYIPTKEELAKKLGWYKYSHMKGDNVDAIDVGQGFIPNLYNPIADALSRENSATGGYAKLSSSPLLRSSGNPLGLAAIDRRIQSSAGDAINQHMGIFGQGLNQIRRAHTGQGFVPNLATGFESSVNTGNTGGLYSGSGMLNSILLAALMNFKRDGTKANPKRDESLSTGFLSRFASEGEKASAKLRLLTTTFETARQKLLTTNERVEFGGQHFKGTRNIKRMERLAKVQFAPIRAISEPYEERQSRKVQTRSRIGMGLALGASVGGGFASQIGESFNASLGAGINEFSNGLTQAGQVLLTFPSKLGMIASIGIAADSAVSAMNVYSKGLHTAQRNFEVSNAKYQQVNAQLDAMSVAMSNYDNMIMDSSVSFEAVKNEQRKYTEALAQLSNSPDVGTRNLAARLKGASGNEARAAIIAEDKTRTSHTQELQAGVLGLKEYAGKRTFAGSSLFGIQPLSAGNATQTAELQQLLRGTSGAAVSTMSEPLKEILSSSTSVEDFNTKLQQAASDNVESAQMLKNTFDDLAKSIKPAGVRILQSQIVGQLGAERASNTPEQRAAQSALRQRNAAKQSEIESAMNQAKTSQRLYVNSGALRAGNALDVRAFMSQQALSQALVTGPESVARRQSQTGVYKLQYGERTVAQYETATELRRLESERTSKVEQVQTEATRNIVGGLTQDFESKIRNADLYKNAGLPGSGVPSMGELGENFQVKLIGAINKGIGDTVASGNLTRFTGANGAVDMSKMMETIAKSSSPDVGMQANVLRYLQANSSIDIMKAILDANKQIASINQESHTEAQKQTIVLQGLLAEMDFKQLANYMGGIKNLLDRTSRRGMERSLVRGATLMARSRTAEGRATGAAQFLGALQEMNIPIDTSENTALSKMMKQAMDIGGANLGVVQQQSMSRVVGATGRLTGFGGLAQQAMMELGSQAGNETGSAAFQYQFKPENAQLTSGAQSDILIVTSTFDKALTNSADVLSKFADSINTSRDKMLSDIQKAIQTHQKLSEASGKDSKGTIDDTYQGSIGQQANNIPKDSGMAQAGLLVGQLIRPALELVAGLALAYGGRKIGRNASKLFKGTKSWFEGGKATKGIQSAEDAYLTDYKGRRGQNPDVEEWVANRPRRRVSSPAGTRVTASAPTKRSGTIMRVELPGSTANALSDAAIPAEESYKQRKGNEKHEKKMRRAIEKLNSDAYNRRMFTKQLNVVSPNIEDQLVKPPSSDIEGTKIYERNIGKANPETAKGRAAMEKLQKRFGKMRNTGLIAGGVALVAMMLPSLAEAATGSESGESPVGIGDVAGFAGSTVANSLMMKTPDISRMSSLKRGGLLALTGLVSEQVENITEKKFGQTAGKAIGGSIDIGAALGFFGKGAGAGVGISIGSEYLRQKFTDKYFGQTVGFEQGLLGATAGGTVGFGPLGGLIAGVAYTGSELYSKGSEAYGLAKQGRAGQDISQHNDWLFDSTINDPKRMLARLTGRENELKNKREQDQNAAYEDSTKPFGFVTSWLSKKQFGTSENQELTQVQQQKEKLTDALAFGDSDRLVAVLEEIREQGKTKAHDQHLDTTNSPNLDKPTNLSSTLDVHIDVDDKNISDHIQESILQPLIDQINELQNQVSTLVNQRSPRPSQVR